MQLNPGEGAPEDVPSILVVDDAADTRNILSLRLRQDGFHVWVAAGPSEALALIDTDGLPDLILLDKMMREMDGFEFARVLQSRGDVPIIFLSVQSDAETKAEGISRYAEDYIIKPFAYPELVARIRRVLNRPTRSDASTAETALSESIRVNFVEQYAVVNGERVVLTPTESRLLELLFNNRGRVLSPDYLLRRLWSDPGQASDESLWFQIRRLRTKLEDNPAEPRHLVTVRGEGYSLR